MPMSSYANSKTKNSYLPSRLIRQKVGAHATPTRSTREANAPHPNGKFSCAAPPTSGPRQNGAYSLPLSATPCLLFYLIDS